MTFTSLFHNEQHPLHGLFVRERIKRLSQWCDVRVVSPVPWAPSVQWLGERYYRYSQIPREELQVDLFVKHPRFVVLPKIGKVIDSFSMAACSLVPMYALRRTFPFEVIDAHWAYPDGAAAALIAQFFRVPLAITVRGDDINIFSRQFWRRPHIRWSLQKAGVIIAVSEELKRRVEALKVPTSKIVVIGNGVDINQFFPVDRMEARRRLGISSQSRVVLSVGRLHRSKGHHILVEAVARLQNDFPDLRAVIIGGSDPEADARPLIDEIVNKYGIHNKIDLIGAQPASALPDWYGAADLFCLPTCREGSPNVILEALACGLPCITTPVGSNPEIISSQDLGFLVPPDAKAIAAAIALGLSRVWDRHAIAAHVKPRTWSVVAAECYAQLSQLVGAGRIRER
jgi:glycosyltransferase involved in cell wall biosynthesis